MESGDSLTHFLEQLPVENGVSILEKHNYSEEETKFDDQYGYTDDFPVKLAESLRHLFATAGIRQGGAALEVGCGTGVLSAALSLTGYFPRLVVTDPSPAFLRICRQRMTAAAREVTPHFVAMTGESLARFPSECFSLIALRYTLHHILDWRQFLQQAHRALNPGGALVVEEPFAEGYMMQAALIHFYQGLAPSAEDDHHGRDQGWYANYLKNTVASYMIDVPNKAQMEDKHLFLAHEIMSEAQQIGFRFRFFANCGLDSFGESGPQCDQFLKMFMHNCGVNLGFPPKMVERIGEQYAPVADYLQTMINQQPCLYSRGVFVLQRL